MIEAIERLVADSEQAAPESVRFSYSRAEQPLANRLVIRLIETISGQPRLERLYRAWTAAPHDGENIFTAGLRLLRINVHTDESVWAAIPTEGPLLFIANHPFGVVDGLMMGHLATRVRPDTKIMTHSLLCQPPEARDFLLPVDFGGTPEARVTSVLTRRRTIDWLNSGHAVAVFPAGSVSTAQKPLSGQATDAAWHSFVLKLLRVPDLTIVPVFFHGQNSRLFQIASHIHYALRVALIFRETARRIGKSLRVSVGPPFRASDLAGIASRGEVLNALRARTYSLAGPGGPTAEAEFQWPRHINFD
jgi:putative hemolysin